jgi:hypothetical protein
MIKVLPPKEYKKLKRRLSIEQGGRCADCGRVRPLDLAHTRARGMGGGWRIDTEENSSLKCRECHQKAGYEKSKFTPA